MKRDRKKNPQSLALPFRDFGGEKLLQFIWQFGYFNQANLTTTEGEALTIIASGNLNKNGGPDFTNARIRIGETTFAGTVELHLNTSDWNKHGHNLDRQYQNVVLHVVFKNDQPTNSSVPVLELEPRISTLLLEHYNSLMNADGFIACGSSVATLNELTWTAWKERLLIERLTRKSAYILQLLEESNGHWEEIFWWLLARNFGMKVNGDAFEAMARSVPLTTLAKHRSSIHQIEALLLGQAGLLTEPFQDHYPKLLQREYQYLLKKLQLSPIVLPLQFLRMRPGNFPTVRLAQLAALMHRSTHLFSAFIGANSIDGAKKLLHVTANDFWNEHYTFRQTSGYLPKTLGNDAVHNILINTVVPVLFAFGLYHNNEKDKEKALRWLEEMPAEENTIIRGFAGVGVKATSAFDSQALIELKNEYCSPKKCLSCAVGNFLLKRDTAVPTPGAGIRPLQA